MLGILRVVEEILDKRPNAQVVINSLFPMTAERGGLYPVISDYRDSFHGRSLAAPNGVSLEAANDYRARALMRRSKLSPKIEVLPPLPPPHKLTDEELAEAAEREEEEREERAKRERKRYRPMRTKKDPVMKDVTRIRKYRPETGFLRQSSKPLWTSIRAINKELRKFAKKQDRVTFFDAAEIFSRKEGKTFILLTERISLRGHPTRAWLFSLGSRDRKEA